MSLPRIQRREAPRKPPFCWSELQRKHETFHCLEPEDHDGPHRGSVYGDPCAKCGALDVHADDCPTPDEMESGPLRELTWSAAGRVTSDHWSGSEQWGEKVRTT